MRSTFQVLLSWALLIALSSVAHAYDASIEETRQLGWCEGVYVYTAQHYQLTGNPDAARNLLARAVNTISANFFLNRNEKGGVSGERVSELKSVRQQVKPFLDANPSEIPIQSNTCDPEVLRLSKRAMRLNVKLFDQTYPEFQATILKQLRQGLGL